MFMGPPANVNGRRYNITAYAGKDIFLHFLPASWQAKRLGKRILTGLSTSVQGPGDITFMLPSGEVYEILDNDGRVRAWTAPVVKT